MTLVGRMAPYRMPQAKSIICSSQIPDVMNFMDDLSWILMDKVFKNGKSLADGYKGNCIINLLLPAVG